MKKVIPLSKTESAFCQMVLEEHAALIRNADRTRDGRMQTILDEKAIPQGLAINFNGSALEYEAPDIEQIDMDDIAEKAG